MSKVSYANLKLKLYQPSNVMDFNGQEVDVIQYLPVEDKYDLIMATLQKSEEDGIYNPLKLDIYFHLNLVYMYTNLSFTDKQRENELKLYDVLKSNGFIDLMLSHINDTEYTELQYYIDKYVEDNLTFKNTAGAVLQSVINDLPMNAQAAMDIVNSFDKTKYQEVINFANEANGNRHFSTNEPVVPFPSK